MSSEVSKWADTAMFGGEPHTWTPEMGVVPKVYLLSMNPDPLGSIAAMAMMYEGKVCRDLSDITDEERRHYFEEIQKTHLQTPLEAVNIHFMLDGVNRSFTHQQVRQRIASFAQESLRFAVIDDLVHGVSLPPSLHGTHEGGDLMSTKQAERWRAHYDECVDFISKKYGLLIADGMPQEDARDLLPHATATRMNYETDLHSLIHHAGNRLCTQAQFHWRSVYVQFVEAIRNYPMQGGAGRVYHQDTWQFEAIAGSGMFQPACYQMGRCPFKAGFDRNCSIRLRVDLFSRRGIPSSEWGEDHEVPFDFKDPSPWSSVKREGVDIIKGIHKEEWLQDPAAARRA